MAAGRRDVERRRKEVHHGIQDRLDAHVAQGRPAEHRGEAAAQGALADGGPERGGGNLGSRKVQLGELVGDMREVVEKVLSALARFLPARRVDFSIQGRRPLVVLAPADLTHLHQVDHALEYALGTNRKLQGEGNRGKLCLHFFQDGTKVRPDPVQLVDVCHARDAVAVRLVPDRFGLGLDSLHGAENDHRAVKDPQGALHFGREIHVPRRVDDVHLVVPPVAGGGRRRYRYSPLLLLVHPVHCGFTVVHFSHAVGLPRVIEDPFRGGGLAGVDVCDDPDVAYSVEVCHGALREIFLAKNLHHYIESACL